MGANVTALKAKADSLVRLQKLLRDAYRTAPMWELREALRIAASLTPPAPDDKLYLVYLAPDGNWMAVDGKAFKKDAEGNWHAIPDEA